MRDLSTGDERTLVAPYFLDATELGDLLPLAGVEFVDRLRGRRARPATATRPRQAQPDNQQSFTCCFAMDYLDGEDHTIDRPAEYAFWRDYVPKLDAAPGPASCSARWPRTRSTLKARPLDFDPTGAGQGVLGLPADRRPAQLPAGHLPRRDHPGELAAERLLARQPDRRRRPRRPRSTSPGPSN